MAQVGFVTVSEELASGVTSDYCCQSRLSGQEVTESGLVLKDGRNSDSYKMLQCSYEILVPFLGLEDSNGLVRLSPLAQKAKLGFRLLLFKRLNENLKQKHF